MSERKLLVLYGTETGNAEDLAFDVGNLSKEFDLEAEVKGMDEVPLDGVISCKRLIICCSTWGEGDQPDNAQDLFDEVGELGGVPAGVPTAVAW